MATGTITWLNASRGHAFITPDEGGDDLLVGRPGAGAATPLFAGAAVEFDLGDVATGRIAASKVVVKRAPAGDPEHGGGARVEDGALTRVADARSWS